MGVKERLIEVSSAAKVTGDIGTSLNKQWEAAKTAAAEAAGAKKALAKFASDLKTVFQRLDKEFEEQDNRWDALSAAEVRSIVKRYITMCATAADNGSRQKEAEEIGANGIVAGLEQAAKIIDRYHKVSVGQQSSLMAAAKEGEADTDEEGFHKPRGGRPSVAERIAEDKGLAKAEKSALASKPNRTKSVSKRAPKKAPRKRT